MRRPRTFRDHLAKAARRVAVVWSALAVAAVVLSWLPMNFRYVG